MKRRTWPILLVSGLALALLVSLGMWQVHRLAWKNQLIADYDRAIGSEAITLDKALEQFLAGKRIDGMKVKATGKFAPRQALRLLTSTPQGPAWELVHGFELSSGSAVLVNRGKINHDQPIPTPADATVEILGHIVWHDQGKGRFDVENKPKENLWYWWDVVAMANQFSATHLNPNYVVLNLVAGSPGTEGLYVETPKSHLRNNHLGYALTWFGLAAVLVVMTGIFLYQSRHSKRERNAVTLAIETYSYFYRLKGMKRIKWIFAMTASSLLSFVYPYEWMIFIHAGIFVLFGSAIYYGMISESK